MLKVVSDNEEYSIEFERHFEQGTINGRPFQWDIADLDKGGFSVIKDDRSYDVQLVEMNREEKSVIVKVNNTEYELQVKDRFDELLEKMGMNVKGGGQVKEIKAPMPGLVLDVQTKVGQQVAEGDTLLVLEAMKMENMIKSPTNGTVKSVEVKKSMVVEKNAVLITFK